MKIVQQRPVIVAPMLVTVSRSNLSFKARANFPELPSTNLCSLLPVSTLAVVILLLYMCVENVYYLEKYTFAT